LIQRWLLWGCLTTIPTMKTKILLLLTMLGVVITAFAAPRRPNHIKNATGTIVLVSAESGWYGIVPDSNPGTRFAPDDLRAKFRVDGLRVTFSGEVGVIPPNVRMWGTPLRLTHISVLNDEPHR